MRKEANIVGLANEYSGQANMSIFQQSMLIWEDLAGQDGIVANQAAVCMRPSK
jgi:hypothetical protein